MRLSLISVGNRPPAWISEGYRDYAKRLPKEFSLELVEIAAPKRGKTQDVNTIKDLEASRILGAVPKSAIVVVMDEGGELLSTVQLAQRLGKWREQGSPLALVVGGADGLSDVVKRQANFTWSLSPLTLPHYLVRVLLAEQVYRAWSLMQGHPYHRGSDGGR